MTRTLDLHLVFTPDAEISSRWNAHCLELDVLTWADSLDKAREMIREAVEIVVVDDLAKGVDPLRRRAPQEDWDAMWARLRDLRGRSPREAAPLSPSSRPR